MKDNYVVTAIDGGNATCINRTTKEEAVFKMDELVCVAQFGEPIYPYLKPIDSVCNAPDSDLWHTLIEADNYHALQLLEYLYAGKVDFIYIAPPTIQVRGTGNTIMTMLTVLTNKKRIIISEQDDYPFIIS